ncbi:hypothetical protein Sango_2719100 [Sesamum angolense]|uniref:Uncharacterized protein n=1 Tax=Sesamum angolense TaxID=2727404 RepID=A0AAE1W399_9LAMI|nr:hypothetical protein Sango_2719100 [Sesamum angolense]
MIPDEPEEVPKENPMEYQDDDRELTEVGVLCLEYVFNGYLAKIQKGTKVPEGHGVSGHTQWQIPAVLEGYSDTSWIAKNSRSNGCSGYIFTLGGGAVSWKSAKQTLITRSTFETALCVLDTTGTEQNGYLGCYHTSYCKDHSGQLVEMIPDEPEEDPEEDPMKCQDNDGELTEDSVID